MQTKTTQCKPNQPNANRTNQNQTNQNQINQNQTNQNQPNPNKLTQTNTIQPWTKQNQRSKISSDQKRLFFAVSLYPLFHFSRTLPLNMKYLVYIVYMNYYVKS